LVLVFEDADQTGQRGWPEQGLQQLEDGLSGGDVLLRFQRGQGQGIGGRFAVALEACPGQRM
jgi:hypothetical protein